MFASEGFPFEEVGAGELNRNGGGLDLGLEGATEDCQIGLLSTHQ